MRVPISWLGEFVELPENVTPEHVHEALVRVGLEEEDVHGAGISGPVVVGTVLEITPENQKNGKTINWCQVDVGESKPRGIVCGAHNFGVGDKVVVSLPGAVLPGPFPISARSTYGHVSDGMIASARELGLGDEHDGILRLASLGFDPEPGADALALLGLGDFAVEVNVTPDRGYAFSMRGIAREYSHATGSTYTDPASRVTLVGVDGEEFPVTIDNSGPIRGRDAVSVFETRIVRGIDATRPTPSWMVSRLALAGVRSISLPVDVTNYVMFELGQPIHGYDLNTLSGGLTVRRATVGETLVTLDGQSRTLHPEDLLITDESGPIGLAGVMGGITTEIGDATTDVLIEAANFDPTSIARAARRHKLPSEASKRFERGVDPEVAVAAASRVAALLVELAGGTIDGTGSSFRAVTAPEAIELPGGYAASLIGVDFTDAEIDDSLRSIGATLERVDGVITVTPPSWRPDLTGRADLVEEVARIVGYDRIPSVLPPAPAGRGLTRVQQLRRSVSSSLAASGLTEVLAYPFVSQAANDRFGAVEPGPVASIALANPLDAEAGTLRTSLLPGLLDVARRNLSRGLTDVALFESGSVFRPVAGVSYGSGPLPAGNARPDAATLDALNAGIPPQPWHVGVLFVGDTVTKQPGLAAIASGITDALSAAKQLAAAVGATVTVVAGAHHSLHPGRTAELFVGDVRVGVAGELLPIIADELDLPRVVSVLEVDLDALIAAAPLDVVPHPIVGFPAATQDLSLVVADSVSAGEVLRTVVEGAGVLLEHAHLVDVYRGTGLTEGTASLTFALRFRAVDRTLTAAEATESKLAAVSLAGKRHGAMLRE